MESRKFDLLSPDQVFYTDSVVHREYRFTDSSFLYRQSCSQWIQIFRFIISIQILLFTEDIDLQIHHFYTDIVVHRGYRFIDLSFLYRQCCSQRIQIYRFIISIQIVVDFKSHYNKTKIQFATGKSSHSGSVPEDSGSQY